MPVAARDSLNRLRGAGLVHEIHTGEFVMPTLAPARPASAVLR